jgi:hypothetical protein
MKLWDIRKLASSDVSYDEKKEIRAVLESVMEFDWDYRDPSSMPGDYLRRKSQFH